jgi:hypothetical protein
MKLEYRLFPAGLNRNSRLSTSFPLSGLQYKTTGDALRDEYLRRLRNSPKVFGNFGNFGNIEDWIAIAMELHRFRKTSVVRNEISFVE